MGKLVVCTPQGAIPERRHCSTIYGGHREVHPYSMRHQDWSEAHFEASPLNHCERQKGVSLTSIYSPR